MNYYAIRFDDSLEHHGILGQKWGKKNGPPYPLDYESHSTKEKKENPKSRIDGNEYTTSSKKGLTDKQKRYIRNGAILVGTVAGIAIAGSLLYKSDIGRSAVDNFLKNKSIDTSFAMGNKISDSSITNINKFINRINPNYNKGVGWGNNCGNCSIAFEANLRGFNASAKYNETGMTMSHMGQFFKGFDSKSHIQMGSIDEKTLPKMSFLASDMRKRGEKVEKYIIDKIGENISDDNASGCIFIPGYVSNHWMSWVKEGNNVSLFDSQNPSGDFVLNYLSTYKHHPNNISRELTAIRLDNLEINMDTIGKVVDGISETQESFKPFEEIGKNFIMKSIG